MRYILKKDEIKKVCEILMDYHSDAHCELNHSSAYELLIATILSAQCTDIRVNQITEELFKHANTPESMLELGFDNLKKFIKSAGFYNMKGKNIMETSRILVYKYDSKVPDNIKDLTSLPGVGRKTANVVLSNCFGVPAIAVDTHVLRVSNRIGFCNETTPEDTEIKLMKKLPKSIWSKMHHVLIFHGRRICMARSPKCSVCPVNEYCLYKKREDL